ncbi:MAG: hypothetical protein BGN83_03410 [Rhizobium sp. 63-7]|nr:MAG: hypothetical protein BGN83_03410 [Rhizobium sp. 63-7]
MPLIVRAEAVHVVVIPEPKISQLLGQDPGADISRHLARYGVSVTLDRLEGQDAGQTLLTHANKIGADLLVMGAYGQPKSRNSSSAARPRHCSQIWRYRPFSPAS